MAAMYSQMAQKKITCTNADIIYFVLYRHMGRKGEGKTKRKIKQCGTVLMFGEAEWKV